MTKRKETCEEKERKQSSLLRVVITCVAGALEIALLMFLYILGNRNWQYFSLVISIVALLVSLMIFSQARTANLKMPWLIIILALPPFGLILYLFVGLSGSFFGANKRYEQVGEVLKPFVKKDDGALNRLKEKDAHYAGVSNYLQNRMGYALYDNSDIEFFGETTDCLDRMIEDLKKAEKFIFMEYYAIEDSVSFGRILEVLKQKAEEGVEVRVFYDDLGSMSFVNTRFAKKLNGMGITCRMFNPFTLIFNLFLNNRDHRKIMSIDGKVAYTGGFNMADEYFHIVEPYGEWKDTAVRIEGDAAKGHTLIFLENWNAMRLRRREGIETEIEKYLPATDYVQKEKCFIHPYADRPTDNEQVGENVYLEIISQSTDYIYISTPYMIISDEMVSALTLAAKRGVDVRMITPGIPDKKIIYMLTRSYYHMLARDGVKIFEYTPGFNHAKMCVADDKVATCGTINFDYRSFYNNFEDGCAFFHCQAVLDEKADLLEMLSRSREVTAEYADKKKRFLRFGQALMRLIAPLM